MYLWCVQVGSSDSAAGQELVEAEAQAEIRQLQREKEVWLTRQREREEERERLAKEREEMGATWGMGEWGCCVGREGGRRIMYCMHIHVHVDVCTSISI